VYDFVVLATGSFLLPRIPHIRVGPLSASWCCAAWVLTAKSSTHAVYGHAASLTRMTHVCCGKSYLIAVLLEWCAQMACKNLLYGLRRQNTLCSDVCYSELL